MKVYLVGGAIRDRLLDLPVTDRDWLVVGASEQVMLEQGYVRAGQIFPVFLHPRTGEEYALARREIKTGPGYTGFEVYAGPEVTLEQDLQRRDLTINAMAEDESGQLIDLFGGIEDLNQGLLRHVSPAFVEDPVRLLRLARFAARLGRWGFRVAHGTHGLCGRMAASPDLLALRRERVWQEMKQALGEEQPWRFFEVLHRCGALSQLIPELHQAMGRSSAHAGRGSVMTALQRAAALAADPKMRFACVMYPAARRAGDVRAFNQRLRAERDYAELLELVVRIDSRYPRTPAADAQALLDLIEAARGLQQPERFELLIKVFSALHPDGAGRLQERLYQALQAARTVTAGDLLADGLSGPSLGSELRRRRLSAIDRQTRHNPL